MTTNTAVLPSGLVFSVKSPGLAQDSAAKALEAWKGVLTVPTPRFSNEGSRSCAVDGIFE